MARVHAGLLVNRLEREVWKRLRPQPGYRVFPKPRMADVIDCDDADWTPAQRGFIRKAHFDFVVSEGEEARPVVCIEVDGSSHEDPVQKNRDAMKDEICRRAHLPLWRFSHKLLGENDMPHWIGHVFELWQFDRQAARDGVLGHPPLWGELEEAKSCCILEKGVDLHIRKIRSIVLVCTAEGCEMACAHAEIEITVDGERSVQTTKLENATLPVSNRALERLSLELAQYFALRDKMLWHT